MEFDSNEQLLGDIYEHVKACPKYWLSSGWKRLKFRIANHLMKNKLQEMHLWFDELRKMLNITL